MPILTRDMNLCRGCKKNASETQFAMGNGKPRGVCLACRAKERRRSYPRKKPRYKAEGKLALLNLETLTDLKTGTYDLESSYSGKSEGYIAVKPDGFFLSLYDGRLNLDLYPDLIGIAALLANKAVKVTDIPVTVIDARTNERCTFEVLSCSEVKNAWEEFFTAPTTQKTLIKQMQQTWINSLSFNFDSILTEENTRSDAIYAAEGVNLAGLGRIASRALKAFEGKQSGKERSQRWSG